MKSNITKIPSGYSFTSKSAIILIILSTGITIFDGLDMMSTSYLAPYIRGDLSLSKIMLGAIFSAGPTGMIVGGFLFAYLGDRIGRRPGIVLAGLAFGLLTLCTAFAKTYHELIAFRFFDGIALGGMLPLICVLNLESSQYRSRATVVTVVMVGYSIGSSLAAPVTNLLAPRYGWPSVYLTLGIATLLWAVPVIAWLPESRRFLEAKAALSVGETVMDRPSTPRAILQPGSTQAGRPRTGFNPSQLFQGSMKWLTLLLWTGYLASTFSIYFLSNWGPTVLEEMGIRRADAAGIIAMSTLFGALAGLLLMRLTDRLGPAAVALYPALAAPLLMLIGLGWVPRGSIEPLIVILAILVHGGHFGIISVAGLFYPTSIRANGAGWATSVAKIGGALAPAAAGLVLATGMKPAHAFGWLGLCPLLLGLCVIGIGRLTSPERQTLPQLSPLVADALT